MHGEYAGIYENMQHVATFINAYNIYSDEPANDGGRRIVSRGPFYLATESPTYSARGKKNKGRKSSNKRKRTFKKKRTIRRR
jgi:hypothetical protein